MAMQARWSVPTDAERGAAQPPGDFPLCMGSFRHASDIAGIRRPACCGAGAGSTDRGVLAQVTIAVLRRHRLRPEFLLSVPIMFYTAAGRARQANDRAR